MTPDSCPRVERIDVTVRTSDGRVQVFSADDPVNPELTWVVHLGLQPLTGDPSHFAAFQPPPPAEVSISFKGHPTKGIIARIIATASGRYQCPEPRCPWPSVNATDVELRAHLLAHELVKRASAVSQA